MAAPVVINNQTFIPIEGVKYLHNYSKVVAAIRSKSLDEREAYRSLVVNDLFFLLFFVLEASPVNHPFLVDCCREVQRGPSTNTLDVWARDHWKSTIITIGETIQDVLRNPMERVAIISYTKALAQVFLQTIKQIFETNDFLRYLFPDVIWDKVSDSPKWTTEILLLKRPKVMKENSIEAHGLLDGMPTGRHYSKRVYDDIMTDDMAKSPEVVANAKHKYDMSESTGMDGGRKRVIGTYYAHNDVIVYIENQKREDGTLMYHTRKKPATSDGSRNPDKLVLLSRERWEEVSRNPKTCATQYQLNPSPTEDIVLHYSKIKRISLKELPSQLYRFMAVDPAGESKSESRRDPWAAVVLGVEPFMSEAGPSRLFILDMFSLALPVDEAVGEVANMYIRNGWIQKLGVEKVGMSTMEMHVAAMLRKKGREVTLENKRLQTLTSGGQSKAERIEGMVMYPLNSGLLYMVDTVSPVAAQVLEAEMNRYGAAGAHDDLLDALAYAVMMAKNCKFSDLKPHVVQEEGFWARMNRRRHQSQSVRNWQSAG